MVHWLGIELGFTFRFPPVLEFIAAGTLTGQHEEGQNW